MNASELVFVVRDFIDHYMRSDIATRVHFGCDCGCGGDSYSSEDWQKLCDTSDEVEQEFIKLCAKLGVEYDY